jgi:hypothetical protein
MDLKAVRAADKGSLVEGQGKYPPPSPSQILSCAGESSERGQPDNTVTAPIPVRGHAGLLAIADWSEHHMTHHGIPFPKFTTGCQANPVPGVSDVSSSQMRRLGPEIGTVERSLVVQRMCELGRSPYGLEVGSNQDTVPSDRLRRALTCHGDDRFWPHET